MMKAEVMNYLFSEMDEHWIESKKSAEHGNMLPGCIICFAPLLQTNLNIQTFSNVSKTFANKTTQIVFNKFEFESIKLLG